MDIIFNESKILIVSLLSKIQVGNSSLFDILKKDDSTYIGGSFPSFCISQIINKNKDSKASRYHDIDIYTKNYIKTFVNFSKYCVLDNVKKSTINVSFTIKDTIIQIITSEFKSFKKDVLKNYDGSMVKVGYKPATDKLIVTDEFIQDLKRKEFTCDIQKSGPLREKKLTERAKEWFNCSLKRYKKGYMRPYFSKPYMTKNIQDVVSPPDYLQYYYNIYSCVCCKKNQDYLLCQKCKGQVLKFLDSKTNVDFFNQITILGGVHGFGKIIANNYKTQKVICTSRNDSSYPFELGKKISSKLSDSLINSNVIIMNAYSTLENDESIWIKTLDTFSNKLAIEKFTVNTLGYVSFLKQLIKKRKKDIRTKGLKHFIKLIFMDANESRYAGKLMDGKHLELNMAKAATKQIFYTNAKLLASLGIITICYDPGWMSYHGISIEQIKSKSTFLIPPEVSAKALIYYLQTIDPEKYIDEKKFIMDISVYDVINLVK